MRSYLAASGRSSLDLSTRIRITTDRGALASGPGALSLWVTYGRCTRLRTTKTTYLNFKQTNSDEQLLWRPQSLLSSDKSLLYTAISL
eukprot:scaffold370749_cov27-Prasinocladus_malaysianus.AAC.1